MGEKLTLKELVERDLNNATSAKEKAGQEIKNFHQTSVSPDITSGPSKHQQTNLAYNMRRLEALKAISKNPFHAMVEVVAMTEPKPGKIEERFDLWYTNEFSNYNEVLNVSKGRIAVLSWTHPGVQLALTQELGEYLDIDRHGYTLVGVKPLARARFTRVLPAISGLYDPGGQVQMEEPIVLSTGLKAVKLDMTPDQVQAFISRMDGIMTVTGAPGSGKTTVAFQRIRFLYDQQDVRRDDLKKVPYEPSLTRVFLANENLINYSRNLLVDGLGIPEDVVEYVPDFINRYLKDVWPYKHEARPRLHQITNLEQRARTAFFGLCSSRDLSGIWQIYESQIIARLAKAFDADWILNPREEIQNSAKQLAQGLIRASQKTTTADPLGSKFRMGILFSSVKSAYEKHRGLLNPLDRNEFDLAFQQWIYWVYDPLEAHSTYFNMHMQDGAIRIRKGTGARIRDEEVVAAIREDWNKRRYGPEEEPWLAWLLRFALPEENNPSERFREIPGALPMLDGALDERLTHVVIDEAQDLSVAEASLLGSLVHPSGALTISADFKQVVSPAHGMTDEEAFKIGNNFYGLGAYQLFPFAKNMRQSQQIGKFLEGFYHAAFGEIAPFATSNRISEIKPQLYIGKSAKFPRLIKQIFSVLCKSQQIKNISLIQINEDEEEMKRLRSALDEEGINLAPVWDPFEENSSLITTSVERIKGLEYDACIVLGLDDAERVSLNFSTNRAYVALSRASRRLFMLCEEFPKILQTVSKDLFEITRL